MTSVQARNAIIPTQTAAPSTSKKPSRAHEKPATTNQTVPAAEASPYHCGKMPVRSDASAVAPASAASGHAKSGPAASWRSYSVLIMAESVFCSIP